MNTLERRPALCSATRMAFIAPAAAPRNTPCGVRLSQRPPFCLLQVSAFASTQQAACALLEALLGLALPAPNRSSGPEHRNLRAVGPGVWHIVADHGTVPAPSTLRSALCGVATVVDLGHARTGLRIGGPAAAQTLAKHCSLDLDATRFPTGSATQTRFGHLGIGLARTGDGPDFELLVPRAYAEFVFETLLEAAAEFGVDVGT